MQQSEYIDKAINIFLAAVSSGSICSWAIWSKYGFIWAIIIATSQFINAIKQFLPYRTRWKIISSTLIELEELLNTYESKWFYVERGELKEDEINKLQFEIRSEKTKIMHKHIGENTLPEKGRLFRKAKQSAKIYINNFYGE